MAFTYQMVGVQDVFGFRNKDMPMEIGVLTDEDTPESRWYLADDVCKILKIKNPEYVVRKLKKNEKSQLRFRTGTSGNPRRIIISEIGFYKLIIIGKTSTATRLRRWVFNRI